MCSWFVFILCSGSTQPCGTDLVDILDCPHSTAAQMQVVSTFLGSRELSRKLQTERNPRSGKIMKLVQFPFAACVSPPPSLSPDFSNCCHPSGARAAGDPPGALGLLCSQTPAAEESQVECSDAPVLARQMAQTSVDTSVGKRICRVQLRETVGGRSQALPPVPGDGRALMDGHFHPSQPTHCSLSSPFLPALAHTPGTTISLGDSVLSYGDEI